MGNSGKGRRRHARRGRFLGGLAAVAVVTSLLLAGCGTGWSEPKVSGSLTQLTTKNVMLHWWVLPSQNEVDWAQALADGFHKQHPNITIKVDKSAQAGQLQAIVAATVAHKLPDLMFSADVFTLTEASKGVLLNLSPYMKAYGYKRGDFVDGMMQLGVYGGKQYVLPRGMDQIVTAYNPALFKKFGVPLPKEGWTWGQFLAASKKLTKKVGGTQYYAMGSGGNTHTAYPIYVPFMKGFGGKLSTPDGKANFTDPKLVYGVSQMMDFAKKYTPWLNPPPSDPFLAGQAAMEWAQRPVLYTCCIAADRKKWTSSFVPQFVNFPLFPTPAIGAGMAGWGATIDTKHPKEAAAFLMYTLSSEGQLVYSKAAGEVPIRTDLLKSTVWRDQIPGGATLNQNAFADYTQFQSYPPSNIPLATDGQMIATITNLFDEMRLGKQTPKDALESANKSINAALKSLNQ